MLHGELPEHDHPASAPVDDFSDASSTTEDAATISQESAIEDDVSGASQETSSRSKLPLLLGLAGLFVVGGGYAFWQFNRPSEPVAQAPIETAKPLQSMQDEIKPPAPVSPEQQAVLPTIPSPSSPSPTASSQAAPSSVSSQEVPPTVPPAPASVPTDVANLYKPTADTTQPPLIQSPPPPSAPPAQAPEGHVPALNAAAIAPQALPPSIVPSTISNAPSPVKEAQLQSKVDALSLRLDQVQKALDQANRQLSQVASAEQAQAPNAIPDVEQRLARVEHNVSQLQNKSPAASSSVRESGDAVVVPHHVKKAVAPKVAKKTVTAAHHKVAPPAKAPTAEAWVLRAATPSEAWIASDSTTSDLKHVQVGDVVQGIGRVKSIDQTGSGWEIVGSDATIR